MTSRWNDEPVRRPLPPSQPKGWADPPERTLIDDGYLVEREPWSGWSEKPERHRAIRAGLTVGVLLGFALGVLLSVAVWLLALSGVPGVVAGHTMSEAAGYQQVPGGNPRTVRVRDSRGAVGEQVPGGNPAATPSGDVGTAIYSASATWCKPTPNHCQGWGGNARLAAVNSFRFGDEPYPVRVWHGDIYADVTVVSHCACHGEDGYIDLSPAAFEMLAPLSRGRIDVEVEVLTDLAPHPDDDRMRDEVRDVLPATDTAP